ncbi:hypothetical protein F5_00014 [Xanthomonas phage F5]|uniref:HNH nuclease domain-containing protein n=1 Tax=Xanthomonas phage F5 TaxID=3003369 RepID=A0AAE9VJD7_9CAUD|nr:hypothetical protein F5_00014 [Xanthomonas phage F5]
MSECIEHTGCLMPNGYGQVRREGKTWLAHRWAAHCYHGPCPEGQVVRHTCDNRKCINPEHLLYGTQRDNLIDRRERHRYRKLTREDAENIKRETGTLKEIGALYGVSLQMVHYIRSGKQWRSV